MSGHVACVGGPVGSSNEPSRALLFKAGKPDMGGLCPNHCGECLS